MFVVLNRSSLFFGSLKLKMVVMLSLGEQELWFHTVHVEALLEKEEPPLGKFFAFYEKSIQPRQWKDKNVKSMLISLFLYFHLFKRTSYLLSIRFK